MKNVVSLVLALALMLGTPTHIQAQDVNDALAQELSDQGFTVVSTRYTWLRRIVVEATDGEFNREILVSRRSGVVLQDNWERIARPIGEGGDRSGARPQRPQAGSRPDPASRPEPGDRPARDGGPEGGQGGGGGHGDGGGGGGGGQGPGKG